MRAFQAVFIITSSTFDDDAFSAAAALDGTGAQIFVIGGGPQFDQVQMKQVRLLTHGRKNYNSKVLLFNYLSSFASL